MDILIFSICFSIFVTYMFFLLRMINRSHKSQEKAQLKYNYKRMNREIHAIESMRARHKEMSKEEK